jgi:nitrite reductase (NADH) large subunit
VIGGGLLGLEAANGLKLRGMDVTVVHLMPWLMERQLDRTAANLLQKTLEAKGCSSGSRRKTEALLGERTSPACQLAQSGEVIPRSSSSWRSASVPTSSSRRPRACTATAASS